MRARRGGARMLIGGIAGEGGGGVAVVWRGCAGGDCAGWIGLGIMCLVLCLGFGVQVGMWGFCFVRGHGLYQVCFIRRHRRA